MKYYGYIYKTTNLLNNMIYIGKKKCLFDDTYFGSGILISRALKKDNISNFKVDIIDYAENRTQLNNLEIMYIKKYRVLLNRKHLYNISDGGDGGNTYQFHKKLCKCFACKAFRKETSGIHHPMFGKIQSNNARKMIGLKNKGKKRTDECRKNRSMQMMGKNNPMYGKHFKHTNSAKEKIRIASIGRKQSIETKNKRSLFMMGDNNPAKKIEVRRKISNTLKQYHLMKKLNDIIV